jgi:hypothetical protein
MAVETVNLLLLMASALAGIGIAAWAGLKGWQGWLELKRLELVGGRAGAVVPPAGGRIELADLKERVRKLEAIAAGIDI